jgi:hypothetical protein
MCCCTFGSSSSSDGCCPFVPLEGAWPVIHKDLYWLLLLLLRPARLAAAHSPVDLFSICLLLLLPFLISPPAIAFPLVFLDLFVDTWCCLMAAAVAVLPGHIISLCCCSYTCACCCPHAAPHHSCCCSTPYEQQQQQNLLAVVALHCAA